MTDRMGVVDAAWLHMDQPTNLMVITSLVLLGESPDWDAVLDVLRERLVERYPRFRQRVEDHDFGGPRWVDDPHFDLALHVQRVGLPEPADGVDLPAPRPSDDA